MAVKFPLKMSDGTPVRTIEELREHFDLKAVLGYYSNGRLVKWLEDRYYDEEAEKVKALDPSLDDFGKNLCSILGVDYLGNEDDGLDLAEITKKRERLELLKKYTADDGVLMSADRVAFTQEKMEDLLNHPDLLEQDDEGNKIIYLFGERFTIPRNIGGITYRGVNSPVVSFDGDTMRTDIDLQGLEFDIEQYVNDDFKEFYKFFDKNPKLGVKILLAVAEKGSSSVQFVLGRCYSYGFGIEQNYEEAVKWYRKAAEQGHAIAQNNLGGCYLQGHGVKQDFEEAFRLFLKAAEQGRATAQKNVGICYREGKGVKQNLEEAAKWYRKAAEQGDAWSQSNLGNCYYNGDGVEENKQEAVKWYRKAAEQGNVIAQSNLGDCYYNGHGVEQDYEEAFKWYRKAAEQGDAWSQNDLGCFYRDGIGVEKNYEEAEKWFQKAFEQGYEEAQNNLESIRRFNTTKDLCNSAHDVWRDCAEETNNIIEMMKELGRK